MINKFLPLIIKVLLLFGLIAGLSFTGNAQLGGPGGGGGGGGGSPTVSFSGPSSSSLNSIKTYNVSVSGPGTHQSTNYSLPAGGGTIESRSRTQVRVKWTSSGTRQVEARINVSGSIYTRIQVVSVSAPPPPPLNGGSIASNRSICYNTSAGTLTNSSSASGGSGTISYMWQKKPSGSIWQNTGATGSSYSPGNLTTTTQFRRRASTSTATSYTNVVTVTVGAPFNPGSINGTKSICYNTSAGTLGNSGSSASGGLGAITYQWQYWNGSQWIGISGTNSTTYSPGNLTSSRSYRRKADNSCTPVYSNTVTVTVHGILNPGSINGAKTICYDTSAGTLGNSASAGGGSGTTTYFWQEKEPSATTWGNIDGASGTAYTTYSPGNLTTDMQYRRGMTNNCGTDYTDPVTIIVSDPFLAGSIAGPTEICYGEAIGPLSVAAPSGGLGTTTYLWQEKIGAGTWTDIPSATTVDYDPGNLNTTTSFQRIAQNNCGTRITDAITIEVQSELTPGSIAGASTICYGEAPAALSNSSVATGVGFSYQWQEKVGAGDWMNITNATAAAYGPGNLDTTTVFRRQAINTCATMVTNEVTVTVRPQVSAPAINSATNYTLDGLQLSMLGTPTGGDIWYWQGTDPNGISETNTVTDIYVTQSGTYYLRAKSSEGCWSDPVGRTVTISVDIPVATIHDVTKTSTVVDWTTEPGATSYDVYRSQDASNYSFLVSTPGNETSYLDEGLSAATSYHYRVQAEKNGERSAGSTAVSVTTNPEPIVDTNLGFTAQHNGNIAAIRWGSAATSQENLYAYTYDAADRLTAGKYAQNSGTVSSWVNDPTTTGAYSVHSISYDPNGNIEALNRQVVDGSVTTTDALTYTYNNAGTQLMKVSDDGSQGGFVDGNRSGDDYAYDAIGNLTKDLNKGITSITYNILDLPEEITFEDGTVIRNTYDASGTKLSQELIANGTPVKKTDYDGRLVYENDTLRFAHHAEGRIVPITAPVLLVDTAELRLSFTFDSSANDVSRNGNNGIVNGPILVADKNGNENSAYSFDGVNDFIEVSDHSSLDFVSNDFTVSYWVKKNSLTNGWNHLVGVTKWNTGASPGTNEWALETGDYNTDVPQFLIESGTNTHQVSATTSLTLTEWAHILGMRKGEFIYIYVNGVLEGSLNIGSIPINNVGRNIMIGKIPPCCAAAAVFDEINIFGRALSESEITELANNTRPGETGKKSIGFDYQYHLTDHLGNTRVTVSATPENYTMIETFETGEDNGFQNLHPHVYDTANTTPGGNEVELLQAGQTGAMVLLKIDPRDTVQLSVQANYETDPSGNTFLPIAFSALFGTFDAAYGGVEGIQSTANQFDDALSGVEMAGKGNSSTAPRAFLNYIFFDTAMNYINAGFKQVSTAAKGIGIHELVQLDAPFIADQQGYLLAYLSNENQEAVNVHFDDFTVYHGKTNVVQADDYYPFGGSFHSFRRTAAVPNAYLYNGGAEYNETTNYYETAFRQYDPMIGRFTAVDPLAYLFSSINPYSYGFNNPVQYNDYLGLAPHDALSRDMQESRGQRGASNNRHFGSGMGPNGPIGSSSGSNGIFWGRNGNLVIDFDQIGPNGGTWNRYDGYRDFESQEEAYYYGRMYNNYHKSWKHTFAGSRKKSDERFKQIRIRELMRQKRELERMMMIACEGKDCPKCTPPKWYEVLLKRITDDMEDVWRGSWMEAIEEKLKERMEKNREMVETDAPAVDDPVVREGPIDPDDAPVEVSREWWNPFGSDPEWYPTDDTIFNYQNTQDTIIIWRDRNSDGVMPRRLDGENWYYDDF